MVITCIIIEDEPLALKRTKEYIEKVPYLDFKGAFNNSLDALAFLRYNTPQLIFLDIKMDELSGIQLVESLQVKPMIIITTAYPEFALKGYDLGVVDYLLKPFPLSRFIQAVEKVRLAIAPLNNAERDFLFIKTEYRIQKVAHDEILVIEGGRDYRQVETTKSKILTLQTLCELERELPSSLFCRVHKSHLIPINKIDSIERNRIKIHNKIIPIGDTYKEKFYALIGFQKDK